VAWYWGFRIKINEAFKLLSDLASSGSEVFEALGHALLENYLKRKG
jgi:hypothetical protein